MAIKITTLEKPISAVIADDSIIIRTLFSQVIENDPRFELKGSFVNGLELMNFMKGIKKSPVVCILDIMMPVCDGLETIKCLRSKYNDTIVYGYTSLYVDPAIDQMYEYGALEVFFKHNHSFDDILDTIYNRWITMSN